MRVLFRSKERLDFKEVLRLIPVRAPGVGIEREGEELRLVLRRTDSRFVRILSWFFTIPRTRAYLLDATGTAVWGMCDGKVNVGELIHRFMESNGWQREQAEQAVLKFLMMLSEKKLVGFRDPRHAPPAPSAGGAAGPSGV